VGWNSHGRRGNADLKTETGGGQEERAKRWWMSSDVWTLNTQYESQGAGDEYVRKAKLNTEYAGLPSELEMPTAEPIQQTERNGIKLVAACIKEGM
jgi:hypothetical protein